MTAGTTAIPRILTLTTDFGLSDTYVGVMKGVILGIAPDARLIDLTHAIAPQNILEASLRLDAALPCFPSGTIHLVVVDPGVGSDRAALVVETETCLLVAPDNGVLTLPLRRMPARRIARLGQKAAAFFRQPVSATFHGRDVFAPIAAHLAAGLPLDAIDDSTPHDPMLLPVPEPQEERDAAGRLWLRLHLLYADRFGNLITDLTLALWDAWLSQNDLSVAAAPEIRAGSRSWRGIARTFADVGMGEPIAYWGSAGFLEIGIRNGNAARALSLAPGNTLTLG